MALAQETGASADGLLIPLIDFSAFLSGDETLKKQVSKQILDGFQNAGFLYLKNHGISPATISTMFGQSAQFFTRSQAEKDSLAWYSARANRGYTGHGREKVSSLDNRDDVEALRQDAPDLKESMEIGRDNEPSCPNMWPTTGNADEFKKTSLDFFEKCKALHQQVMRSIAVGLGIDEAWFDRYTETGDNTLRLLHYPPARKEVFAKNKNQVRAGAHTDYGSVTLLFQDNRGGLQVQSPKGTFINATPIPGTIIINAGDLLARWSNDTIKSTNHRVVEPPLPPGPDTDDTHPARYSIAYFCNPDFHRMIEVIPGTCTEEQKKYEPVNSGEYLVRRLEATY